MKRLLFLSLLLLIAVPAAAEMLSVIHLPAELRAQPLVARSQVLSTLPRYAPLEVVAKEADYYRVKTYNGQLGYIHRSLVKPKDSLSVTANSCNVRTGPGTDYAIAFKATKGQSFRVISKYGEWVEIVDEKEQPAWIWKNLTWGY